MAKSAGYLQSKRKKSTSTQPNIDTIEGLASFARSKGFEREADKVLRKPKLSFLQRVGRGLSAFEVSDAMYQSRYEQASFLGTYIDDIGSGLKAAVTGYDDRITPTKTFKDILVKEGAKDRPGKLDAVDITGLVGDILFDPTTFFGSPILKGANKLLKGSAKVARKIPAVDKAATAAGKATAPLTNTMGGLFKAGFNVKQLGPDGEKYFDNYLKHLKSTRAKVDDYLSTASNYYKNIKKAVGRKESKKAGEIIGKSIESNVSTGNKQMDEMVNYLKDFSEKKGKEQVDRGIISRMLPNWMHHMLTPEAADHIAKGGVFDGLSTRMTKVTKGSHRTLTGTAEALNEWAMKDPKYGYKLFEEDAFKAFSKSGVNSIQQVETFDFLKRIGQQFGKEAKEDFIDDAGVQFVKSRAGGLTEKALGDVRLPKQIADHIDTIQKTLSGDESTNAILKLYDKILAFWKGSVTGYFPAFHSRNAIGGVFNNWIGGVNNPLRYADTEKILQGKNGIFKTDNLGDLSYERIRKAFKEGGVVGQTGYLDVSEYLTKKVNPTAMDIVKEAPQKIMGVMEDRMRGTLFIDTLKKSKLKNLDDAIIEASKKTIKFHFDYMPEGFSAFEKNVMKRVIPFYTWTRHNIPLQLEQMIMQPGKYAGVFKTQRAWGAKPSSEEEAVLPKWLKERYTVKAEGGYWSGLGLPLEEAADKLSAPMRGFGTSLSPLIKTPIEKLTGWNIFKETSIEEDYYGKQYKNAPQFLKNWLGLKETTSKDGKKYYTVNPKRRYWLEAIGARGLNTALRVADATDDKKNLLSLVTTIKKYNYDIEDLKRWSDNEKRDELEKALQQAGELYEYKTLYVPKNYK